MGQKPYKVVSSTITQSALDEWEKMSEEIKKAEVSLFEYEVPRIVEGYLEERKLWQMNRI